MLKLVRTPTLCRLLSPSTLLEVAIPVLACLVILCSRLTPGLSTTLLCVILAMMQWEYLIELRNPTALNRLLFLPIYLWVVSARLCMLSLTVMWLLHCPTIEVAYLGPLNVVALTPMWVVLVLSVVDSELLLCMLLDTLTPIPLLSLRITLCSRVWPPFALNVVLRLMRRTYLVLVLIYAWVVLSGSLQLALELDLFRCRCMVPLLCMLIVGSNASDTAASSRNCRSCRGLGFVACAVGRAGAFGCVGRLRCLVGHPENALI